MKYAATFDEKVLGVGCDIEIVVDMESGDAQAMIAMRAFLRSTAPFRIAVEDLVAVANAIKIAKSRAKLLEQLPDGANDHQMHYASGGATLIVVHPPKKKAHFTLSIGGFSREGDLESCSDQEISDAAKRVEQIRDTVRSRVMAAKAP